MQFRGKFHPHLDSYPRHHINQNQRLAKKRHLLVAFMIQGAWELRFLSINSAAIALLPRQEITYAVAQITSNSTTEFAEENSQDVTSGEPLYSAEQSGTLY